MGEKRHPESSGKLGKTLSRLNVWAISFGCAVGWGAFIMPGTTFLPIAGPVGTVIGIILGAIIMLIIGVNYSFMIDHYPDAGGAFTYTYKTLGFDHGFLCSWFMILVFMSIAWANATALPLIFRNLIGNFFQFGFHYQIAGYDVYFGEAMLSVCAIVLLAVLTFQGTKLTGIIQTICAIIMLLGIGIGFISAVTNISISQISFTPAFSPDTQQIAGTISIIALAPWAFVGFETISHAAEEFEHTKKDVICIIILSVIFSAFSYAALTVIAVSAFPNGYSDWYSYIKDIDKLEGFERVPVFNAVYHLLGQPGIILFIFTILGAIITGILGHSYAMSRLMIAMKRQNMLPSWLGNTNKNGTPINLICFLVIISLPVPFLGRSVIGWIVDISTVGAAIAYLYTSYVSYRLAKEESNRLVMVTGAIGSACSTFFFLFFLLPNFSNITALSTESYLTLVIWSIIGFIFFHYVYHTDKEWRFGNSTVVWTMLLFLIFFTTTIWARQTSTKTTHNVIEDLINHQRSIYDEMGLEFSAENEVEFDDYLVHELDKLTILQMRNSAIQITLVILALIILFSLYASMIKRQKKAAEDLIKAKNTFLSNISHEIRTPINTILGLDEMIMKETTDEGSKEYANDIYIAGQLLISLVNDVLDFSKIDSGNLELSEAEYDFSEMLSYTTADISNQAKIKGLLFDINIEKSFPKTLYGDSTRLRQIFLNLLSNAIKYTEEGRITLNISYTRTDSSHILMQASVIDTGIGIHKEDLDRLFNTFDRINDKRSITASGAGLGMNIVKNLLNLMGGTLEIESVYDVGSNFTFSVPQEVTDWTPIGVFDEPSDYLLSEKNNNISDFTAPDARILLVDDTEMNLFVFESYLKNTKMQVDTAKDGLEGLELTRKNEYDLLLIDHRMPFMDGVEMFHILRSEKDNPNCEKPCICVTANAGIGARDEYTSLGFDDYLAKPVSSDDLKKMIVKYLPSRKVIT